MRAKAGAGAIAMMAMLAVAGCSAPRGDGTDLMNLKSKDGPDEFAILPPKPLTMPDTLSELPDPTPGGSNRTDPTPEADAIVALGGKPQKAGGIPAADGALYAQAARYGVEANIRGVLAGEDLEWRRDHKGRILERLLNVNVYYRAYRKQSLDQHAELEFWRARGVRTPSAPPPQKGEN
ncbi:MAG: DUF3035 domain-containing protein [Rhodobacteraceae bacterium]|jgi:hypothetical protein|nr:DUF3035 domain-containing protein [Paracoccaceae bacterium]